MESSRQTPGLEMLSKNNHYAGRFYPETGPITYSQPYPELVRPGKEYLFSYQSPDQSVFGSASNNGIQPSQGTAFRQEAEIMPSGPGFSIVQDFQQEKHGHTRLHESPSFQPSVPDLTTRRTPPDPLPFLSSQQSEVVPGSMYSHNHGPGPSRYSQSPGLTDFKQSNQNTEHSQGNQLADYMVSQGYSYSSQLNQLNQGSSQLPHPQKFSHLISVEGHKQEQNIGNPSQAQMFSNLIGGDRINLHQEQMFSDLISGNGRVLEPMQPVVKTHNRPLSSIGNMHEGRNIDETARRESNAAPDVFSGIRACL
jgi:hypothetical protein